MRRREEEGKREWCWRIGVWRMVEALGRVDWKWFIRV